MREGKVGTDEEISYATNKFSTITCFLTSSMCTCLVAQSFLTLCDPMDCSPPGSSVHGILQARVQEWVAILFSRVSSWPGDWIQSPAWSVQFSSFVRLCPTLCDPMDCITPGFPVHHQPPELSQTHVHRVGDAIQPSHPLSSPYPPAFNLSQHQDWQVWSPCNSRDSQASSLKPQFKSINSLALSFLYSPILTSIHDY